MSNIGIQLKDKNNNNVYPNPFPVGAIYMSVDSRNPSTIFGGTWTQIKDRFLLAAGDTYKSGNTGGSTTHLHSTGNCTLTVNQIPSHTHSISSSGGHNHNAYFKEHRIPTANYSGSSDYARKSSASYDTSGQITNSNGAHTHTPANTGGGQAHNHGNTGSTNHMPPYYVVYIWRRTA